MSVRSMVGWVLLVAGCGSPPLAPSPLSICRFPVEEGVPAVAAGRADVRIVYDATDSVGVRLAQDLSAALWQITGVPFPFGATRATSGAAGFLCDEPGCPRHVIAVGTLAQAADVPGVEGDLVRTRRITIKRRNVWLLEGNGARNAAFAAYQFLAGLGVRYLHPRATFFPSRPALALGLSLERTEAPGFSERIWRLDTVRATPASWALLSTGYEAEAEARRIVDWVLANGQTEIEWTLLEPFGADRARSIVEYAHERGLRAGADVILYRGADRQVSLVEAGEQGERIRERVAAIAAAGFDDLAVSYDGRATSRVADDDAVRWLAEVDAAVREQPGFRWRLEVRPGEAVPAAIHTVDIMGDAWRDMAAAAGAALAANARSRDTGYIVPSAAGQGFDIDAPLLLPASWYARWSDANRLLALPEVRRHVTVDAGWEWGYWANDAVIFAVTWDRESSFDEMLHQLAAPLGRNTCNRLSDSLAAAAELQYKAADEGLAGEIAGRPVIDPFTPSQTWPQAVEFAAPLTDIVAFSTGLLVPLGDYVDQWTRLERSLVPTLPRVDPSARPFVQELIDGFAMARLKAGHRLSLLQGYAEASAGKAALAEASVRNAREIRNLASLIVSARESQYRYDPQLVSGVYTNQTAYPAGYLYATRELASWQADETALERLLYGRAVTGAD